MEAVRDFSYFRPVEVLFRKKKAKIEERMGGRTSKTLFCGRCARKLEENKTDTAFTQHKHDKYSLQTKGQKPADEKIFKRHVKLQADPRRIRDGARDSTTISIGQNKIGVNQDRTCASS